MSGIQSAMIQHNGYRLFLTGTYYRALTKYHKDNYIFQYNDGTKKKVIFDIHGNELITPEFQAQSSGYTSPSVRI
jgi:hypothetical protein